MIPTLTEPLFLDTPNLSGPSGELPLYRSVLFGKAGSAGIPPGPQPAIDGFPPPAADQPFGGSPFSEATPPPAFGLPAGAPGGTGASPGYPSPLWSWEQGSSADFLGWLSTECAPGAPLRPIREMTAAAARGLAGLFSAGRVSGIMGQRSPGAAGERFSLPVARAGEVLSRGRLPSAALASAGKAARKWVSQISRGWDAARGILFARNGSNEDQGRSALADPLWRWEGSGRSPRAVELGGQPSAEGLRVQGGGGVLEPAGSLRVGRVADGEGGAAKTIGEQILEALKGMPGSTSLAGAAGTTLVFPRGLWMEANEWSENWEGFPGSLFGREEGGVAHPEAEAGLQITGGEPLRAMVGAARNLPDEQGDEGGESQGRAGGSSAPLVILLG